eukprot:TRINITY_DN12889_c0_g1_i1.p1 TRINITY_DN12889_c0_g1~~TRINITY_DN12889_c0_g1_i1.p1  ORF type:complete len:257 (-),score=47.22 TRINITY_DN12889_c0_g1_i1:33-755(-)
MELSLQVSESSSIEEDYRNKEPKKKERKGSGSNRFHIRSRSATDALRKHSLNLVPGQLPPKPKMMKANQSSESKEKSEQADKDELPKEEKSHGHQRARSEIRPAPRRDSKCYPFSEKHVRRHNSNIGSGAYAITSFDEYMKSTDHLRLKKSQSAESSDYEERKIPVVERKLSKPQILEARKRKNLHSRTQSHPELKCIEVEDNSDALKRQTADYIITEPVEAVKVKSPSKIKKILGGLFS